MNELNISIEEVYNLVAKIKQQNEALGTFLEKRIVVNDGIISIDCDEAIVLKILPHIVII